MTQSTSAIVFDGVTTRHVCEGVNVTLTYITGIIIHAALGLVIDQYLLHYCIYIAHMKWIATCLVFVENSPCLSIPMTFKGKQHISCDVFENSDVVQFIHRLAVNLLLLISQ